jgi:8-oxo-dGTP diphosphatase
MSEAQVIYSETPPGVISYVVMGVRHDGKWLFIRHRERGGFELPAGHPEENETTEAAAVRELMEETGAEVFELTPVCYYTVCADDGEKHGRLFFGYVTSFGEISDSEEVEGIVFSEKIPGTLSLPVVMKALFERLEEFNRSNAIDTTLF